MAVIDEIGKFAGTLQSIRSGAQQRQLGKQNIELNQRKIQQLDTQIANQDNARKVTELASVPEEVRTQFIQERATATNDPFYANLLNKTPQQQGLLIAAAEDSLIRSGLIRDAPDKRTTAQRNFQTIRGLETQQEQDQFLALAGLEKPKIATIGDVPTVVTPRVGGAVTQQPLISQTGQLEAVTQTAEKVAGAKIKGTAAAKEIIDAPRELIAAQDTVADVDDILTSVNDAIRQTSPGTTGAIGGILKFVPYTDARALRASLESIKANLAIGAINKMREMSKTGGALGNVTEGELRIVERLVATLDQELGDPQLLANMNKIGKSFERWKRRLIETRGKQIKRLNKDLSNDEIFSQLKTEFPTLDALR